MEEKENIENKTAEEENTSGQWNETDASQYVNWEGQEKKEETPPEEPKAAPEPPRREYGTQYGYYGTTPGNQNYYSQNGGQWDFNRYESAPAKKPVSGFKIFIIIVAILLGLCIIGCAAFGILSFFGGRMTLTSRDKLPILEIEPNIPDVPSIPNQQDIENIIGEIPEFSLEDKPDEEKLITTKGELSASEIYNKVIPSVVGVVQYQYSRSMDPAGTGSGIIISEDGYIITNHHVISGAEAAKVILYNGEEYEATVIGSDEQTDIAVLKIDAKNLTAAELGDSDKIEVGEKAYVLGNPGGLQLQSSITDGIISGLNRTITLSDSAYEMTLIQTSAAINPGNSGGALVNEFGQVIGITSSKLVSTRYEGVGFAIPTSTAIPIAQQLISQGYVSGRAKLGITGRNIDSMTARYYSVPTGVMILTINDDGSFAGSEAQVGDIITKIDGTEIGLLKDLSAFLAQHTPGDEVEVTLYRYSNTRSNDTELTVKVKLIESKG